MTAARALLIATALVAVSVAVSGGAAAPSQRGQTPLWRITDPSAQRGQTPLAQTPLAQAATPEARAVAYLTREVPRWRREHPCYSCHNNGDAARALIVAATRGHDVGDALDDTLQWLRQPQRWSETPATGGIDDKPLARIQFAGALRLAVAATRAPAAVLSEAAGILATDQKADGSWQLDSSQSLGSPTTYGTTLATAAARLVLAAANRADLAGAAARADAWLRRAKTDTVLDAAAVTLGLDAAADDAARAQRERALLVLKRGQAPSGGWGPYVTSQPEVFDTALVMLALDSLPDSLVSDTFAGGERRAAITRGRAYLLGEQLSDGSWPETTRPANQESYAQRISTTGWALLALLETSR